MKNSPIGLYVKHKKYNNWGYGRILSYERKYRTYEIWWMISTQPSFHYEHRLIFIDSEDPNELIKKIL